MSNDEVVNDFGKKIDDIFTVERLNYRQVSELTGIPYGTLNNYKSGHRKVSAEYLTKICRAFPQYTMWLMVDQTNPEAGQISPAIKLAADKLKTG